MVPVAEYSRDSLKALREETGITYDERTQGTLQLFRTQSQYDGTGGDIDVLKQFGVPYNLLDPEGCIAAEPALANVRGKFVGGLQLPGDETGDCQMFTEKLAARCAEAGVTFRFNTTITSINTSTNKIASVSTETEELTADAYVIAFGSYSPFLLRRIGVHIPVYPVKGYSITVPITDPAGAPVSTVMDESYKVAITRLGDRIRVGGTAEISGYDLTLREARRGNIGSFGRRSVPQGRRYFKSKFLDGPAPNDARWPANHRRRDKIFQSLSQYRPWDARMDHGMRVGPRSRRSGIWQIPGCRPIAT